MKQYMNPLQFMEICYPKQEQKFKRAEFAEYLGKQFRDMKLPFTSEKGPMELVGEASFYEMYIASNTAYDTREFFNPKRNHYSISKTKCSDIGSCLDFDCIHSVVEAIRIILKANHNHPTAQQIVETCRLKGYLLGEGVESCLASSSKMEESAQLMVLVLASMTNHFFVKANIYIQVQDYIHQIQLAEATAKTTEENTFKTSTIALDNDSTIELTNSVPEETLLFRNDKIEEILRTKDKNPHLVLYGLGGIGKTSIARCLYHRLKKDYKYVAWIPYQKSLENSILQSFHGFEDENSNRRLIRIKRFLQNNNQKILLIIDNVDSIDGHDTYLDELTGTNHTLILTSRMKNIVPFQTIKIDHLSEAECIELFYHYYGQDPQRKKLPLIIDLIQRFQYHTMTIELLAKSATRERLEDFYHQIVKEGIKYPELRVRTNYSKYNENMQTQLKRVFNILCLDKAQQNILRNFALMPSIDIPIEVRQWLKCDINDLEELTTRGWLSYHPSEDTPGYYMHPIIKETLLADAIYPGVGHEFVETLAAGEYSYCQYCYQYYGFREPNLDVTSIAYDMPFVISHKIDIAQSILKHVPDKCSRTYARALTNLGLLCQDQAIYEPAREYYENAMEILNSQKDSGYDISVVYTLRAIMEKYLSQYKAAEEDFLKALDYLDHAPQYYPIQAVAHNILGDMYRIQSKYSEARIHLHKAKEIRGALFGENSREIAISYNDCAILDEFCEQYEEAEKGYKKMEEIAIRLKRTETPTISALYHNLGRLYFKWNKYDLAHQYYERALAMRLKLRGEKHSDTASTYRSLGELYLFEKDYVNARECLMNAHKIAKDIWPSGHIFWGSMNYLLAQLHHAEGDDTKAKELAYEAYTVFLKRFGENHPNTLHTKELLGNLASFFHADKISFVE